MRYETDYHALLEVLNIARLYHEIGIYNAVFENIDSICEDDYMELCLSGIEAITSRLEIYDITSDEDGNLVIMGVTEGYEKYEDCEFNTLYYLYIPEMLEYYRLCRLYELQHSIEPENNEFVIRARNRSAIYCDYISGGYGAGAWAWLDNALHATRLEIEFDVNYYYGLSPEIVEEVHNIVTYFKSNLKKLQREIMRGPVVFLPALPAWKGDEENVQT